jgi:hypothetical protein
MPRYAIWPHQCGEIGGAIYYILRSYIFNYFIRRSSYDIHSGFGDKYICISKSNMNIGVSSPPACGSERELHPGMMLVPFR